MNRMLRLLVSSLALTGCAGVQSMSEYDSEIDFAAFRTFAMAPLGDSRTGRFEAEKVKDHIASCLWAKGLKQVPVDEADLVVSFSVGGREVPEPEQLSWVARLAGGRRVRTLGTQTTAENWSDHYIRGTLVVDIAYRPENRIIWHAWAKARLEGGSDTARKSREAIVAIMDQYPPGTDEP